MIQNGSCTLLERFLRAEALSYPRVNIPVAQGEVSGLSSERHASSGRGGRQGSR